MRNLRHREVKWTVKSAHLVSEESTKWKSLTLYLDTHHQVWMSQVTEGQAWATLSTPGEQFPLWVGKPGGSSYLRAWWSQWVNWPGLSAKPASSHLLCLTHSNPHIVEEFVMDQALCGRFGDQINILSLNSFQTRSEVKSTNDCFRRWTMVKVIGQIKTEVLWALGQLAGGLYWGGGI